MYVVKTIILKTIMSVGDGHVLKLFSSKFQLGVEMKMIFFTYDKK